MCMWAGLSQLPRNKEQLLLYSASLADVQHMFSNWIGARQRFNRQSTQGWPTSGEFHEEAIEKGGFATALDKTNQQRKIRIGKES